MAVSLYTHQYKAESSGFLRSGKLGGLEMYKVCRHGGFAPDAQQSKIDAMGRKQKAAKMQLTVD